VIKEKESLLSPQADDLGKVISLVKILGDFGYKEALLKKILHLKRRQIGYYRSAAEILSLVEQVKLGNYQLTEQGRKFVKKATDEQKKILVELIHNIPLYRIIIDEIPTKKWINKDKIEKLMHKLGGLSKKTAHRRTKTFLKWASFANLIEIQKNKFMFKGKNKIIEEKSEFRNGQNVWLWAVSPENWKILVEKNIWASSNEQTIRNLVKKGDKVIFYVSGVMQIKGVYEFVSDWYEATQPAWIDEDSTIKYPSQIKIKPIALGSVKIHDLVNKLSLFNSKKLQHGKLSREQSLILKPGSSGFPSNNTKPIDYEDLETIINEMKSQSGSSLQELSKKGLIVKTHLQVLQKFHILRRKIVEDSTEIRGIRGKSPIPPDSIVGEPHYMHNLVRGVYKPSGDEFALSIQTNPNSKWGVEIDFDAEKWTINYDFEDESKYSSDIESLKKCYEREMPIGVIYKHKKGVNEILGLGKIVNHNRTLFEIVNYNPENPDFYEKKGKYYAISRCEQGDYSSPYLESSAIRRTKQDWFREKLFEIHGGRCALCGLSIDDYLIAAHIVPFNIMQKEDSVNTMNPANGILLCRICDTAFEKGHIMISEDYEIIGNDYLKSQSELDSTVQSWLANIHDKLEVNTSSKYSPDKKYLKWKLNLI